MRVIWIFHEAFHRTVHNCDNGCNFLAARPIESFTICSLPVSQRRSRILERQRASFARAAGHKFQINGAARSAASGGDCWPYISVRVAGSSSDGGRLSLAGLLMGTFQSLACG